MYTKFKLSKRSVKQLKKVLYKIVRYLKKLIMSSSNSLKQESSIYEYSENIIFGLLKNEIKVGVLTPVKE